MESTPVTHEGTRPTVLTGAIVGGLVMAVLLGLSYLGSRAAGLPSVADDLFAWIRDLLPGDIVTAGIDAMVDTIISLNIGEDLDSTAKFLEQASANLMVIGLGIVVGALLYSALRSQTSQSSRAVYAPGLVTGLVLGVIVAFISRDKMVITNLINPETFTVVDGLWIVGLFTAFGLALSWVYLQLVTLPVSSEAAAAEGASAQAINRRQFLVRVGGASAVLTVIGAGLGRLLREDLDRTEVASSTEPISTPEPEATAMAEATDMPDATAMLEPAPGTRPEYTPLDEHYRIDISTRPPRIREAEWALLINGLVETETMMTLSDLRNNYEPVDQLVTLSCISNRIGGSLISTTRWTGVPLKTLLEDWNVSPEASYMKITSADGFDEYVSLDLAREDERVMLTYEWDGKPLKEKHGFPLRIYIPNHYGMKQPKWIIGIEMVDEWDEGYWVRRGWSEAALVRTTSVVDTVATDSIYEQGGQMYVPVGGIAYSGARGISKVEVQVDEGEWTEAQLLEPLSQLTWVLWRYDWPFQAGEHTFAVRCYDGNGTLQITERNDVRPDGATGIHTRSADIEQAQVSA